MNSQLVELLRAAKSLIDAGEYIKASNTLASALACKPSTEIETEIYFQIALCEYKERNVLKAVKSLETALDIADSRDDTEKKHLYDLLRIVYKEQPNYQKLAELCRKLLSHTDDNNDKQVLVSNLLYACLQSEKWDEMAKVLDAFPDVDLGAKALLYKVICFTRVSRIKEAFQASCEYTDKFGEDPDFCASLLLLHYSVGDAPEGLRYYKKAVAKADNPEWLLMVGSKLLAHDVYQGAISDREYPEIIDGMRQNSKRMRTNTVFQNVSKPFRKIRLGYLSSDLGAHPVGYFLLPVMATTVTSHSFIKCYSLMPPEEEDNPVTQQFMTLADSWGNVYEKPDSYIERMFLDDEIDIAFDMMCHTKNNRLQLFARRLAPVQISWIGFPVTSGVDAMDYVITDECVDPPGSEKYYTEKLLYMPENFLCHILSGSPQAGPPAFIKNGYITFACFHNLVKVTDITLRMWSRILENNKTAILNIMGRLPNGVEGREMIDERFRKNGIPMERVSISPMCDMEQYFAAYNEVDIMLDTYPFSGATTTFDALRMGRPIITLVGERHVSRVSYSLLRHVGLEELAACSEERYVENAIALANDHERLLEINQTLPERIKKSPLTDQVAFRKNYEKIIRDAWVGYCFQNRTEEYDYSADTPPELLEQVMNATVYLERKIDLGEEIGTHLAKEYYKAQKAFYEKLCLVTDDESFIREYRKLIELISHRQGGKKNFRLPISIAKRNLAVFCDGEL